MKGFYYQNQDLINIRNSMTKEVWGWINAKLYHLFLFYI
jgi:hypothetical protein